ncbi:MAG: helix-turn-helix domain-containing protein [Acidobacteriaceae bacterium]
MNNYADVYMTPEQVAEKLQIDTETVRRWLRRGKLRGNRISHKAWRISERELASFMKQQNVSELLFEEYIAEHGFGPLDHHPTFPGTTKLVDYRLNHNGQILWFEVKEFADDKQLVNGIGVRGGAFDPYVAIRRMIGRAREKFRDYDGECCTLVLFNERANLVHICTPDFILGAMLGNLGIRVPINFEGGEKMGPITNIFTTGGKLIHPHLKTPQNTTISAIIALERFPIGHKEFRIKVEQKERDEQRKLPIEEFLELMEADQTAYDRMVLRAMVYENPHAGKPLPASIFTGPFDERWGHTGEIIGPIYTGSELSKLQQMEHDLELDVSPFFKMLQDKSGDQSIARQLVSNEICAT